MIDAHATLDCIKEDIAEVPCLIVPAFSESVPIIQPGSSTKLKTAILKVLTKSINLLSLIDADAVIAPAYIRQSFARIATDCPSKVASPVIRLEP